MFLVEIYGISGINVEFNGWNDECSVTDDNFNGYIGHFWWNFQIFQPNWWMFEQNEDKLTTKFFFNGPWKEKTMKTPFIWKIAFTGQLKMFQHSRNSDSDESHGLWSQHICRSIKQSFAWLMTHKWYDNRWTWHFFPPFIRLIVSGSERQQQKSGCSGNKNHVLSIDAHFQFQAYLPVCFRLTQSQLLNYKMILHLPWIREYDCSLFIILSATRQKTNGI